VKSFIEDKRQLLNFAAVLALAAILLWPAYVNGEPFYMADTSSYLRGSDAAVHRLTGERTAWTDEYFNRYPAGTAANSTPASSEPPVVLAGRSIYYGFLLYLAQFLGNFWAVAVVQALLVATAIALTIGALRQSLGDESSPASVLGFGALLAACTPVGYFTSYLLPDVFGALGLLAFAHLAFLWNRNRPPARFFWFVLLTAAMLFHSANFLLVGLLTAAAVAGLLLKLPSSKAGLVAVASALLVSAAGQMLFTWGVRHATGAAPVRPPFIAARIIDDGPGYEYLRERCPEARLIYCRVVGFETRISDLLLWSKDPRLGIFQALPPAEQRLAASQERRFVLAVLADRPLDLAASSIGAFFRQLTHFDLTSFNYSDGNKQYFNRKIPSPFIEGARQSMAFQNKMPTTFIEWATVAAVLVSLAIIFWRIAALLRDEKRLPPAGAFLLFLAAAVLLNAAVCGTISTPKGRYQMRLIWILPLAALAVRPRRLARPSTLSLELAPERR
jgi:hypothetical protein